MKKRFSLPTNWCVIITEKNRKILESYRVTMNCNNSDGNTCLDDDALNKYLIVDDRYSDNMYWGFEQPDKYVLISFEDFQKYILKKVTIIENYDYLIPLLKNII